MKTFIAALVPPDDVLTLATWGLQSSRALTAEVDSCVISALAALDPSRIGLYAVGGYGRRELAPFSDIDLLFVTRGEIDLGDTIANLWNFGFKPSILIRRDDQVRTSAAEDLHFATTILEARWLWGLEFALLLGEKTWIGELRPDMERELEQERIARQNKHRGAGYQEPNIREGRGGLRDLQSERWLANVLGLPALFEVESADDPAASDSAVAFPAADYQTDYNILLAARLAVHAALGRREDCLMMAEREIVRQWLKWSDADLFFKSVFSAMKRVALRRRHAIEGTPSRPTAAAFARRLTYAVETPLSRFLRECDEIGFMGELIPEWKRIDCLPRGDTAHWFTPEEHTLRVVERLEILLKQNKGLELQPEIVQRPDLLVLAALFHDIGKGSGHNHEQLGSEIGRRVLTHWRYAESDADLVAFLVREHSILSYHAFMRDVDDPGLIHELARRIGDLERLTMLYLLTLADLMSVSDDLYTDWKANLLNTLTARLARQCQHYLPPDRLARESVWRRRTAVTRILREDHWSRQINDHFQNIDAHYALGHTPEEIVRHIQLIPRLTEESIVIEKNIDAGRGYGEVTVITRTHSGLFAKIAGTLAARGFNILEAHIATREDGIAIDTFKVSIAVDGGMTDESRWRSFESDLRKVLAQEITVEALIARRQPYVRRDSGQRLVPRVSIDNEISHTHTVVEIMASDEPGLLYRLARAFRDCGIEITSAIVTTEAGLGVDIFYVSHEGGGKITDRTKMTEMEASLGRVGLPTIETGGGLDANGGAAL